MKKLYVDEVQIREYVNKISYQMYKDAASEEMEWAKYLFKDGTMIGLNSEILIQYMKWLTNNRLKAIRMETIFDKVPNPISWITNWTESKSIQEAPQETEKETYVVGAFQQLDAVAIAYELECQHVACAPDQRGFCS
jgi:ribonucleoside-diphosphate reductase beta chain